MKAGTHLTLSPLPPVLVLSKTLKVHVSVYCIHRLASLLCVCVCVLLKARGGIICESIISEK